MSEWKTYKLGDIASVQTGPFGSQLHQSDYVQVGTPIITVEHLGENRIVHHNLPRVNDEDKNRLSKYWLREDDIVFSRVGSVDRRAYVKKEEDGWLFSGRCLRVRPTNKVNGKYLSYFFGLEDFKSKIRAVAVGATMPSLNTSIMKNIEVIMPESLTTQTQIAQILTSLDDKIELNLQMNQTLEAMAQAIFKEWFVDFKFPGFDGVLVDGLPKGWKMGELGDIVEFINGYAFKSDDLLSKNEEECYHVFKMGHIKKGGGLKYDGTKSFYKKCNALKLKKYILKTGDLLMCMTDMKDNVALLGHTALMNEDDKYIVNQRVGLIRPMNKISIDYPYLYILTNYPEFITEIRSKANRGVQVNLSTNEIKNMPIVIPPKLINEGYDNATKPIFNKVFSNIEQIQILTQTRDALLPKLMSGKIEIKN